GLKAASVVRACKNAKACLNLAARLDARIGNAKAWTDGLASLPNATTARNTILSDSEVREVVRACAALGDPDFALLVEVLAVSGVRPVKAAGLTCGDLKDGFVMMPRSAKGRSEKRVERRPLPLPPDLITKLRAAAAGRPADEPLLRRPDGGFWHPEQ